MRSELITAAAAILLLGGSIAAAQSPAEPPAAPPERVEPLPGAPSGGGSLGDRLDAADGVLKPPPTGDGGLVEQPPATGSRMPVIQPSVVPPGGSGDGSP